jgi:hypothetical protein
MILSTTVITAGKWNCCDELRRVSFAEALTLLLGLFQEGLKGIPVSVVVRIQALLDSFLAGVPAIMRRTMHIPACKYR